ncbi:beta-lactamase-like protein [Multifurca ochricompacta]|uniref:Beta-lactamase-like protein n=1 Tax=Multifurca ochricompacta TaxID=376703 RepID=A0AAD4LYJ8_9AGAM|nr:beta-lactamase-like protein [Multifurca ochricompacta]
MPQWMTVTFLGTSSGGGPSESRNCSSLILDIVGDGTLWMIDGAEGTLRQFSLQPSRDGGKSIRVSRVNKIFVTHMHADHVMGIPTLLRNILGFPHPQDLSSRGTRPRINLYGPAGLRAFIRTTLSLTRTKTAERYAVHELLTPNDSCTPCDIEVLHDSEEPGRDVLCDEEGFWRDFTEGMSNRGSVHVCAGPLVHRDPCVGYIFYEPSTFLESRKLAILGDTSSTALLTPLISSTPGRLSLLVHEATDAHIPANIDSRLAARRSFEIVSSKVQERGHSTPIQAGICAGQWGARQLVLNHIGVKFPAPTPGSHTGRRAIMMGEIERQANEAWHSTPCEIPGVEVDPTEERKALAAYDFMNVVVQVHIPAPAPTSLSVSAFQATGQSASESVDVPSVFNNVARRKRRKKSL